MKKKMIPIYVALVRAGLRTIDQVPASIRDDVKAADGGDATADGKDTADDSADNKDKE